ncbi:MAG: PAS domain S-box protein, partial [Cyanobacteria bacterium J06632_3]
MDTTTETGWSQLEQELHAEMLATLKCSTDVILLRDIEGRCLKIISGQESKLYRPAHEILGKTLHETLPKDTADTILSCLHQSLRTQQVVRAEYVIEIEGTLVHFSTTFSPINNSKVAIVAHDITERKKAEAQLSIYALITKNLGEGICLIRASDGAIVYTNPKFEKMFGYQPFELIGESSDILSYDRSNNSHHKEGRVLA